MLKIWLGKTILFDVNVLKVLDSSSDKVDAILKEKVCKVYLESTKKGKGATTVDGKMIDEVHYKQAKTLLDIIK